MVESWSPMADLKAELDALAQKQDDLKSELSQRRKSQGRAVFGLSPRPTSSD